MEQYRIHFFTHSGEIFGGQHFGADNDKSAIEVASKTFRSPWGKGHEVWHGSRLVHREEYK